MKRLLIGTGIAFAAAAAAITPAVVGLSGNPSFGEHIPVRVPSDAKLVLKSTTPPPSSTTPRSTAPSATHVPAPSRHAEPGDDHGGAARHAEPGDDRGGATRHVEPGDDRGTDRSGRQGRDDQDQHQDQDQRHNDQGHDDHGGRHSSDDHASHG